MSQVSVDEIREFQAALSTLKPRACGCPHELISAYKGGGKAIFCPVGERRCNPSCAHPPEAEIPALKAAIHRAREIRLISGQQHEQMIRWATDASYGLEMIDYHAQFLAEMEQEQAPEDDGPFDDHPIVLEMIERQEPHVEVQLEIIAILKRNARGRLEQLSHMRSFAGDGIPQRTAG